MTLIQILLGLIITAAAYAWGQKISDKRNLDLRRENLTLHDYVAKVAQNSRDAVQRGEARGVLRELEN